MKRKIELHINRQGLRNISLGLSFQNSIFLLVKLRAIEQTIL